MQTQRMSPGADVCEKSIRTKSEDVDNDLDFDFISIHVPRVGSDRVALRIAPELKDKLQTAADAENRTVSGHIINLIMQDIAKNKVRGT